jgi:hypothetical protein
MGRLTEEEKEIKREEAWQKRFKRNRYDLPRLYDYPDKRTHSIVTTYNTKMGLVIELEYFMDLHEINGTYGQWDSLIAKLRMEIGGLRMSYPELFSRFDKPCGSGEQCKCKNSPD